MARGQQWIAAALVAVAGADTPLQSIRRLKRTELQTSVQAKLASLSEGPYMAALSLEVADAVLRNEAGTDRGVAELMRLCGLLSPPNSTAMFVPSGVTWEVWCNQTGASGYGNVQANGRVVGVQLGTAKDVVRYVLSTSPGAPKYEWPEYGSVAITQTSYDALAESWLTPATAQQAQSSSCGPASVPLTTWAGCGQFDAPASLPLHSTGASGVVLAAPLCSGGQACSSGHLGTVAAQLQLSVMAEKLQAMQTRTAFGTGGAGFVVAADATTSANPATLLAGSVGNVTQADGSPIQGRNVTYTSGDSADLRCQILAISGTVASGCSSDAWQSGTVAVAYNSAGVTAFNGSSTTAYQWRDMRATSTSGIQIGESAAAVDALPNHWSLGTSTLHLTQDIAHHASTMEVSAVPMPNGTSAAGVWYAAAVIRNSSWSSTSTVLTALRDELVWEGRSVWEYEMRTQPGSVDSFSIALAQIGLSLGNDTNVTRSTDTVVSLLWALCDTYPQHESHFCNGPQGQFWSVRCTNAPRLVSVKAAPSSGTKNTYSLSLPPGAAGSKRWPDYGSASSTDSAYDAFAQGWSTVSIPSANTALAAVWSVPYYLDSALQGSCAGQSVAVPVCGTTLSGSATSYDTTQCSRYRATVGAERPLPNLGTMLAGLPGLGTNGRAFIADNSGTVVAVSNGTLTCAASGSSYSCTAADSYIASAAALLVTNLSDTSTHGLGGWLSTNGPASNTASTAYSSRFTISMTSPAASWVEVTPLAPPSGDLPSTQAPLWYLCLVLQESDFSGDMTMSLLAALRRTVGNHARTVAATARDAIDWIGHSVHATQVGLEELPATDTAISILTRLCRQFATQHYSHRAVSATGDYYEARCPSLLATETASATYGSVGVAGNLVGVQHRSAVAPSQPLRYHVIDAYPGVDSTGSLAWTNYGAQAATEAIGYNATATPWFTAGSPAGANDASGYVTMHPRAAMEANGTLPDAAFTLTSPVCDATGSSDATSYDSASCVRFTAMVSGNCSTLGVSALLGNRVSSGRLGARGAAFMMLADENGTLTAVSHGDLPVVSTVSINGSNVKVAEFPVVSNAVGTIAVQLRPGASLLNSALRNMTNSSNGTEGNFSLDVGDGSNLDASLVQLPHNSLLAPGDPHWYIATVIHDEDFAQDQTNSIRLGVQQLSQASTDASTSTLWRQVQVVRSAMDMAGLTGGMVSETDFVVQQLWRMCERSRHVTAFAHASPGGYYFEVRCKNASFAVVVQHGGTTANVYASPTGRPPAEGPFDQRSFLWPDYGTAVLSFTYNVTAEEWFQMSVPANNSALAGIWGHIRLIDDVNSMSLTALRCGSAGAATWWDDSASGCSRLQGVVAAHVSFSDMLSGTLEATRDVLGQHGVSVVLVSDPTSYLRVMGTSCPWWDQPCNRTVEAAMQRIRAERMRAGTDRGYDRSLNEHDSNIDLQSLLPPNGTAAQQGGEVLLCTVLRLDDWAGEPATKVPVPAISGAARHAAVLTALLAAALL